MTIRACLPWTASGCRHDAARAASLILLASLLCGWGCGIGREVRQPTSDRSSRIEMSQAEARQVDEWDAGEGMVQGGMNTVDHRCKYWSGKRDGAPANLPGARRYAEAKAEFECEDAARWADQKRREEAERIEREKAAAVVATAEIAGNQCETGNRELMEQWMFFIKDAMVLRFGRDRRPKTFVFADQKLMVANPEGIALQFGDYLGGELHIFAFSILPVTLEVFHGDGQEVTLASPWADQIKWRCSITGDCIAFEPTDPPRPAYDASKMVLAGAGEALTLRVRGQGCSLLMIFRGL